ncbi:MAG: branched-chain amino acid ABC transporter permease [Spirochaetales bacterium]|nr:branched-chain amino acid ABC transporter permease [Spirochaetales bacterium]
MDMKRYRPIGILLIFVICVQLVFTLSGTEYFLTQIIMAAYYCLVILGLCLLMGYTGQISLGHAGFFAIGGYTQAVLTTINLSSFADSGFVRFLESAGILFRRTDLYGEEILSFSPWIAIIAAIVITIGIAFLIGIPVLRLKGHYLAMATLGFGMIIYTIVIGTRFLGEADGITKVPPFQLLPGIVVCGKMAHRVANYYVAWFLVIVGMIVALNLVHSRVGRALRAIHGSEEAANAMGIHSSKYKLYIFVLSAVFASVGGIFLTHYNGSIGPSETSVIKSVRYVAIVAVGGMDNLWGCLFMGILLNFLSLRGVFGSFDEVFFGLSLIVIMLFAPHGILRIAKVQELIAALRELPAYIKERIGKKKKHERHTA